MSENLTFIKEALAAEDYVRSRELLREALKSPDAEVYYLAAQAAVNEQQHKYFLEKALELDPFHEAALRELDGQRLPQLQPVGAAVISPSANSIAPMPRSTTILPNYSYWAIPPVMPPQVSKPGTNPLSLVAILGGTILALAPLLPWITVSLRNTSTLLEYSVTGLGGGVGSASFIEAGLRYTLSDIQGGTPLVLLGVAIIVIAAIVLAKNVKKLGYATLILSILGFILIAGQLSEMLKITSTIITTTVSSQRSGSGVTSGLTGGVASGSVGYGIYVGLVGALLGLLGSILILAVKKER